jgi:plasmid stabilization system protein ParE
MRVRYTPRALADLAAILAYIRERHPAGARSVREALEKTVRFIAEYPHVGRRSGEQDTRVVAIGRYPYLIYWGIEAGELVILHIRHAARRPWPETDDRTE